MNSSEIIAEAQRVIDEEVLGVQSLKDAVDDSFVEVVEAIQQCEGRLIITAMGKSGHIYKKVTATMASLGLKTLFMHPAEGLHGDLGLIYEEDIVLAVSRGGESEEVIKLIPSIKTIGARLIAITEREQSSLAKLADVLWLLPSTQEAYLDNLVPTTSTTVSLVAGDALAVVLAKLSGFRSQDFAIYHPNGLLGRRLTLSVADIMKKDAEMAVVSGDASVREAVLEMCAKPVGCVCIVDEQDQYVGIFTDGDLRRLISRDDDEALNDSVEKYTNRKAHITESSMLVDDALKEMQTVEGKFLSALPVIEDGRLVGILSLSDISKAGLL